MRIRIQAAVWTLLLMAATGQPAFPGSDTIPPERAGREILSGMVEANRDWLLSPPVAVKTYAYTFHRFDSEPTPCVVVDARRAGGSQRQGITYSSLVHHVARHPEAIRVTSLEESGGMLRLTLAFTSFKGGCGNGIHSSWHGYFNLGGNAGLLVLDAERLTPVSTIIGDLEETFHQYVELRPGRYAPLAITLQNGTDMRFEWAFRVHKPGLWLLDRSRYHGKEVAWVDGVTVNDKTAEAIHRLPGWDEREQRKRAGETRAQLFLDANRHWLLPPLEERKGLVYDYRQEGPYRERVFFDPAGNVMVQLEASEDSPDRPTHQRLWLREGRAIRAHYDDPYVCAADLAHPPAGLLQDRMVQHLAMGLGLDCALTRFARSPGDCWTEVRPAEEEAGPYTLILHWRKDARLFTGTMLAFRSWAYMHDVRYQRSEILCDASTHRPREERDYADGELVGHVFFDEYMASPSGDVPGQIRAIIHHEEEGQDRSLEMAATFQILPDGPWLLREVHSSFRGREEGSTGTITVLETDAGQLQPARALLERLRKTQAMLRAIEAGPEHAWRSARIAVGEDIPFVLRPGWTAEAQEAAQGRRDDESTNPSRIGIHHLRADRIPEGGLRIMLTGIAQCEYKAYRTAWTVQVHSETGETNTAAVEIEVRSEGQPNRFTVEFVLPEVQATESIAKLGIEGVVQALSGMYHGHGMWMTFQR